PAAVGAQYRHQVPRLPVIALYLGDAPGIQFVQERHSRPAVGWPGAQAEPEAEAGQQQHARRPGGQGTPTPARRGRQPAPGGGVGGNGGRGGASGVPRVGGTNAPASQDLVVGRVPAGVQDWGAITPESMTADSAFATSAAVW